jgi:hypothetical protein
MRRTSVLVALLLLPVLAGAQTFTASLSGDAVVPGPGAAEGSGLAVINFTGTTVSYSVLVSGVTGPTSAHVNMGAAGASGDVVIDLGAAFTAGAAVGTASAGQAVVDAIVANPSGYYLEVDDSTSGAVRGQLVGGAAAGYDLYFPVAAAISGTAGTFFKTDARLVNMSGGAATVALEYYPEGAAGNTAPSTTDSLTIAAGAEAVLDNFVASSFGVSDGKGAVVVRSDVELTGFARIYNDQVAAGLGTFGQLVEGLEMDDAETSGLLPFLSNEDPAGGEGYRANIGWFNPNASPVNVTFTGYAADGTVLGQASMTVAGWAQQQFNVAADALWPALADYGDFYVTFSADGALFVYASVVDNVNGDAIYVPAS